MLMKIYKELLNYFGKQDWWPVRHGLQPPEWEIWTGAVLTQNTNWKNVEKALENMKKYGILTRKDVIKQDENMLAEIIRPSGYYRQKARKLKAIAKLKENPSRDELLSVWGVGPETADSILLYACKKPFFVMDAYTRRVFSRLGLIKEDAAYEDIRRFFESSLPRKIEIYMQYHALIVELAKRFCKKTPRCEQCPISYLCLKSPQASGRSRIFPMRK